VNAALAARMEQMQAEADHRRAVAEFRERRAVAGQRRIEALLTELVAVLAQLPLEADAWPNQFTGKRDAA
jgi:hypothetical protein